MKREEYESLYRKVNNIDDFDELSKEFNVDKETIFIIYSQKRVRDTTKRFYKVKNQSSKLVERWRKGKSFVEIAKEIDFSEVLTASIILRDLGVSKRVFWAQLRNPDKIEDERLSMELREVAESDLLYSPKAMDAQRKRGRMVEDFVLNYLTEHGIEFKRERELRKIHNKTPDFVLPNAFKKDGFKVNWIECKASFGDAIEVKRTTKRQLAPYLEQFGSGVVFYWYGYLEDLNSVEGIMIVGKDFFKD